MNLRSLIRNAGLLLVFLAAAGLAEEYTVQYFMGTVQVKRAGSENWQKAELQMKLATGDTVKTHPESNLELKNAKGQSFHITELQLVSLSEDMKGLAAIRKGGTDRSVWDRLKTLTGSQATFQVTTPTAVAAIRGKAAEGFEFTDTDGDGINDVFIEDDNSALTGGSIGVDEDLMLINYSRETRGRHGIHDDIRPTHWSNERLQNDTP